MTTFIAEVLLDLRAKGFNLSELTFILPSKRAGTFLKHELSLLANTTLFAPETLSIEEFVADLSGLTPATNTELLFHFYNTYLDLHDKAVKPEPFESFSKWAQILLQDFNEIDRYLIPQKKIFDYLGDIQELSHWSLEPEKTEFVQNYLSFWNSLHTYYNHYTTNLLQQGIGYQGLLYRKASENIQNYSGSTKKTHIFLGFNALNTAEENIIQTLLKSEHAHIYWDIDKTFIENPIHDAGLFTREHKANWKYFKNHPFNWITTNYSAPKNMSLIGIPKTIGQAKYIGTILKQLSKTNPNLANTAVVLGDENLLIPVLNSIPKEVKALNVTMGFPLKSIPLATLFESLFDLHKKNKTRFYYKDIITIVSHQFIRPLLQSETKDYASIILNSIKTNNLVFLNKEDLFDIASPFKKILELLFGNWHNNPNKALESFIKLITAIKTNLNTNKDANVLALEYAFKFNELFNNIKRLNSVYPHLNSLHSLHQVYKELLSSETLDFQGEPLQGLQVMGMLESRVLDFETVILSSVNEGILPAGKSNNSFIPFDVKLENKLPTYKEKDAVYTYHFYRLLQRAKQIFILYNTEADALTGGEKSRFITQLELENIHHITHKIATPTVPVIPQKLNTIQKTPAVINRLKAIAEKGFSPSSLSNYVRNPIDFYYDKVLHIKTSEEVEETVAANTLGTVVHNTLEDFYKPLEGQFLTESHIKTMETNIPERVAHHFKSEYKKGDFSSGKNLIIFEIAKRYVSNFLKSELKVLSSGNEIKIIAIESEFKQIPIAIPGLAFPVTIGGKVDRVDECNGITRIIDYKTGKVEQNNVELVNWDDLNTDYKKYSKPFQILCYAYMMQSNKTLNFPVEAGIISFKNLNSGFLKFAKKDKNGAGAKKDFSISNDTIEAFKIQLQHLITEIFNPEIPFIEKEV
ncbi:PD-(D/E)XK nuclease family protein [Formosa sp. S-31]|uniref:PD-(D/E)XK nuclease family protein n=1 Tax=Formosa sp. S-31 TaxID=2790949 RepID=UPI003EBB8E45